MPKLLGRTSWSGFESGTSQLCVSLILGDYHFIYNQKKNLKIIKWNYHGNNLAYHWLNGKYIFVSFFVEFITLFEFLTTIQKFSMHLLRFWLSACFFFFLNCWCCLNSTIRDMFFMSLDYRIQTGCFCFVF
jgi:hypothetical protein